MRMAITWDSKSSRCIFPKHRQECLCHTILLYWRDADARESACGMAQTLLSVLVRLGRL